MNRCSVAPYRPGIICSASPTTLLFEAYKGDNLAITGPQDPPREVRWLDLSTTPPQYLEDKTMALTPGGSIFDMCFVKSGTKHLLVTIQYTITKKIKKSRIYTYDTDKKTVVWSIGRKLRGMRKAMDPESVTADGRGHLFVADNNNGCIHEFTPDGDYVGVVLKAGEQDLGKPKIVRWWEDSSSLIVAHEKDTQYKIGVFPYGRSMVKY